MNITDTIQSSPMPSLQFRLYQMVMHACRWHGAQEHRQNNSGRATTNDRTSTARFMSLPSELRMMIYRAWFTRCHYQVVQAEECGLSDDATDWTSPMMSGAYPVSRRWIIAEMRQDSGGRIITLRNSVETRMLCRVFFAECNALFFARANVTLFGSAWEAHPGIHLNNARYLNPKLPLVLGSRLENLTLVLPQTRHLLPFLDISINEEGLATLDLALVPSLKLLRILVVV